MLSRIVRRQAVRINRNALEVRGTGQARASTADRDQIIQSIIVQLPCSCISLGEGGKLWRKSAIPAESVVVPAVHCA